MSTQNDAKMALWLSTFAFSVCFACWVINAILVTFFSLPSGATKVARPDGIPKF